MSVFRAAVIQMDSSDIREENLRKIQKYIKEAKESGADWVVLPETVDYIGKDFAGNAWPLAEAEEFFGNLARRYQLYLHCGSITEKRAGKPYNTTLFMTPEGESLLSYRKLHMFDATVEQAFAYRESDEIEKGNQLVIAKTPLAAAGFAICYDIRFGEMFRLMAQRGAELFCVCADFTMATGKDHWETLLRSRAIENGCYVLASNQMGSKPGFAAYGNSMIIDPWGMVIARSSDKEGIVSAKIDTAYVNQVRTQIPSLSNVRDDIYQLRGQVELYRC